MNFFKSILAEPDPEPASPPPETKADIEPAGSTPSPPAAAAAAGGWGFGGLLKTLTSQSETVLETYRRDLAEFGTGLRRETEVLREAAARAARDIPSTHALDGLADIVAQGKDALSQVAAAAAVSSSAPHSDGWESEPSSAPGRVRYSRFDAQLRALQADPATFTADPEDAEDFAAWSKEFNLDERKGEIEALCYESDALEEMADRLVPDTVESEVFWSRYFYRVHKLKQQEDARAKLVKRVIAQEEEEDLSWEVDDEDEEQQEEDPKELPARQEPHKEEIKHEDEKENEGVVEERKIEAVEEAPAFEKEQKNADEGEKSGLEKEKKDAHKSQPVVLGSSLVIVDVGEKEEPSKSNVEESGYKKGGSKHETSDLSKDNDYSIVSRQRTTVEDEDLEWDEIEDLGEHDEKKGTTHDSSPVQKEELRKRLSVAEDDEDLSWDIEDDCGPISSPRAAPTTTKAAAAARTSSIPPVIQVSRCVTHPSLPQIPFLSAAGHRVAPLRRQDDRSTIFAAREAFQAAEPFPELDQAHLPERTLRCDHLCCYPPCTCCLQHVHDWTWSLQHVSRDWEKGVRFLWHGSDTIEATKSLIAK